MYSPVLEICPNAALSDQVTEVWLLPITEAKNCCIRTAVRLTAAGVTDTDIEGSTIMVAESDIPVVGVAVAIIVWGAETEAGAVYSPEPDIVPICGLSDHLNKLLLPVTLAES